MDSSHAIYLMTIALPRAFALVQHTVAGLFLGTGSCF